MALLVTWSEKMTTNLLPAMDCRFRVLSSSSSLISSAERSTQPRSWPFLPVTSTNNGYGRKQLDRAYGTDGLLRLASYEL